MFPVLLLTMVTASGALNTPLGTVTPLLVLINFWSSAATKVYDPVLPLFAKNPSSPASPF